MESVKATDVRNRLQDVLDRVHYTKEPVIITKRGKPWVVVHPLPADNDTQVAAKKKK